MFPEWASEIPLLPVLPNLGTPKLALAARGVGKGKQGVMLMMMMAWPATEEAIAGGGRERGRERGRVAKHEKLICCNAVSI